MATLNTVLKLKRSKIPNTTYIKRLEKALKNRDKERNTVNVKSLGRLKMESVEYYLQDYLSCKDEEA